MAKKTWQVGKRWHKGCKQKRLSDKRNETGERDPSKKIFSDEFIKEWPEKTLSARGLLKTGGGERK